MATTGRGDSPLRSRWMQGRPPGRAHRVLWNTPYSSDDQAVVFSDWFFEAGSTTDDLLANGIASGTPSVESPALGQVHALLAVGISAGAPEVGTPVVGQIHALSGDAVSSGTPQVGTPVISQVVALLAVGISSGTPDLGTPVIGQVHAFTGSDVASGTPALGTPVVGFVNPLLAVGISAGTPTVGSPAIAQSYDQRATARIAPRARNISPEPRTWAFRPADRDGVISLRRREADLYLESRFAVEGVEL